MFCFVSLFFIHTTYKMGIKGQSYTIYGYIYIWLVKNQQTLENIFVSHPGNI